MTIHRQADSRLARFAWWTVVANLVVILWGAFVRATGSGAGCGNHWPLCNGQVLPRDPTVQTVIEFVHRATSGIALILVVILLWWARRAFAPRHPARTAAWVAMVVMLLEAAIGAGLVKFELVADNASMARTLTLGAHLLNTLVLLAALVLMARWSGGAPTVRLSGQGRMPWLLLGGTLALIVVGVTGVIASLGDTLFPARTLGEGLAQDLDPTSHLLLRLRVLHPILAVLAGALVWAIAATAPRPGRSVELAARRVTGMVLVQWTIGATALLLLVPIPLQLMHLLAADLLWIAWILLAAELLADQAGRTSEAINFAASESNTSPAPSPR